MKIAIFISILVSIYFNTRANSCNAKDSTNEIFEYSFPETLPDKYKTDAKKLYLSLLPRSTRLLNNELSQRYTEAIAFDKKYLIENGFVYIGWDDMELYLNNILKNIIPDSLRNNPFIHVYPARLTDANAYCFGDGTILFNIGLFASIQDEASIAILLGHELAHYINNDAINVFLRNSQQHSFLHDMIPVTKHFYTLRSLEYSREQEQEADNIGFMLAGNAGYDIESGLSNFAIFSAAAKNYTQNTSEKVIEKYSTHPLLDKRIKHLEEFIKNKSVPGKTFLSDKETFLYLKRCAIHEYINLTLSRLDYERATEYSFIQFLSNPSDAAYAYYTAESIRRFLYLFEHKKDDPFLSHILKATPDTTLSEAIAKHPWISSIGAKTPITNDQAYRNCIKYSMEYNSEGYLSAALYHNNDTIKRNTLIKSYLSSPQSKHKEYASALLENNLYNNTGVQSLLIFNHLKYKERLFAGEYTDYFTSQTQYTILSTSLKNMLATYFPEKELIAADSSFTVGPAKYFALADFKMVIEQLHRYRIQDLSLFKLEPKYWHCYRENSINAVTFLSVDSWINNRKYAESSVQYIFLPGVLFAKKIANTFTGPSRFFYEIDYKTVSINERITVNQKHLKVKYKLREPNFLNSVYHVLKEKPPKPY